MDINHIVLPASVVAELYRHSLVDDTEPTAAEKGVMAATKEEVKRVDAVPAHAPWKSLGSNQKNILIIVKSAEAVYLPDNELTFLAGILGACKLSLADVAIVNSINHPEAGYKELTSFFKSKIVLLFDMEPAAFGLPMSFPHYQLQSFAGNSFLYAPSLKELENDRVEKSKLWVCLKRLFNL
jgi:hypothetical protein